MFHLQRSGALGITLGVALVPPALSRVSAPAPGAAATAANHLKRTPRAASVGDGAGRVAHSGRARP